MITHWKLANFKSVRNATRLQFAPLTIFAGPNSSGKTTLLQSILLISQTLAHKITTPPLLLNGPLARLGDFHDIKCADADADAVTIGCVCVAHSTILPSTTLSCEASFTADHLLSANLTVTRTDPTGTDRTSFISLRHTRERSPLDWLPRAQSPFESTLYDNADYDVQLSDDLLAELRQDYPSARPAGCSVTHFLPRMLFVDIDQRDEFARTILTALTTGIHPHRHPTSPRFERVPVPPSLSDFIFAELQRIVGKARTDRIRDHCHRASFPFATGIPLTALLEQLTRLSSSERRKLRGSLAGSVAFERLVTTSLGDHEKSLRFPLPLPQTMAAATKHLDSFFSGSLRYLGPLRDDPKAFYPLASAFEPTNVGLKGEHTAAVLDLHKNTGINYMPSSAFRSSTTQRLFATASLRNAVTDWLRYLRIADNVETVNQGKFGHQLAVSVPHAPKTRDLTHVGVGVSQVLPILVAGLIASSDAILVFEQPELHLHPGVQALLADFFLSLSMMGKQCIVETHSEHIINRLRLREATSVDPLREPAKIYFVERDEEGSSFREVVVNEYGAIANWPVGFFDQGQREAERILRAATTKRRTHAKEKN